MKRIIITLLAVLALAMVGASPTVATQGDPHKVVVCKYVGTPGVDERLQTGNNPIVVDEASLEGDGFDGTFPFEFEDAHGKSIAIRYALDSHDGSITECPGYVEPTPTPSLTPTPSPSDSPQPSETPSPSPSAEPSGPPESPTPTPSQSTPTPTVTAPPTDVAPSPRPTLPPTDTDSSSFTAVPGSLPVLLIAGLVGLFSGLYMLARPTPTRRK